MKQVFLRLTLAGLMLLATRLPATQFTPARLDDLAAKAQLVLQGTVLSKSCQQDDAGRIYTKVELQVAEVWKGTLATNRCTVVHGGGILGDRKAVVSGQADYQIGEEVVVFLVLSLLLRSLVGPEQVGQIDLRPAVEHTDARKPP